MDGVRESCLAIATTTAEEHTELWVVGSEPTCSCLDVILCCEVVLITAVTVLYISLVSSSDSIDRRFVGPWQPKTLRCNLSFEELLFEHLYVYLLCLLFLIVHMLLFFRLRGLFLASR